MVIGKTMKILATADIHYDLIQTRTEYEKFIHFIKSLEREKPDMVILAGDTAGFGSSKLEECLDFFRTVAPERLMVFGNHEYWSSEGDTFMHLETTKTRIKACGFKLLDEHPEIIDGIGFAGNCAWYDYSFAGTEPPPRSSYEKKMFGGHIIWNDFQFVRLGKTDRNYSDELLEKLEVDIQALESEVDQIVVVTHHVGFMEMLAFSEDFPGLNFCNAFMGNRRLGDMLLRHPKVRYHICGHTHARKELKQEHLISINPGSTYDEKKFQVLTIDRSGTV
jgi:predicted phosphodiesterase